MKRYYNAENQISAAKRTLSLLFKLAALAGFVAVGWTILWLHFVYLAR